MGFRSSFGLGKVFCCCCCMGVVWCEVICFVIVRKVLLKISSVMLMLVRMKLFCVSVVGKFCVVVSML